MRQSTPCLPPLLGGDLPPESLLLLITWLYDCNLSTTLIIQQKSPARIGHLGDFPIGHMANLFLGQVTNPQGSETTVTLRIT